MGYIYSMRMPGLFVTRGKSRFVLLSFCFYQNGNDLLDCRAWSILVLASEKYYLILYLTTETTTTIHIFYLNDKQTDTNNRTVPNTTYIMIKRKLLTIECLHIFLQKAFKILTE